MGHPVAVLMGSDSDWEVMRACAEQLKEFGVGCHVEVMSAHRSPLRVCAFASSASELGFKVLIAGAGMSAALAGTLAAHTTLPVIGVPLASGALGGLDALLCTVQMPPGTPAAGMAVGAAGARNAALLAVQILALSDPGLASALQNFKSKLAEAVDSRNRVLQERLQGGRS